jgi:AraC-like DNA-binding protein
VYFGFSCLAGTKKPVTDTLVERLLNQSKYMEVSRLILTKLKNKSNLDNDHRLYYSSRLSIAQIRLRNIDTALLLARQAFALSKLSKDSSLIVDAWKALAYSYNNAGNLDSALYFTRKMMLYGERSGDQKLTRNAIVSISSLLSQNKRFEEALHYSRNADQLTQKINDSSSFSLCKFNIGLIFLNLNQTDSCLYYLNKSVKLAKKMQQNDLLIYNYGTMADLYLQLKDYKLQKKYLLLANSIAEKIGNKQFLAMGYCNLANGSLDNNNHPEALVYGEKALALLKEQPFPVLKMKVDSMMCAANKHMGRFDKAFPFLESFVKEKEKQVSERQQTQLNELMVSLQVREKNLTIANQQLYLSRNKQNIQVLTLVIFIILILVFGQFLYIFKTRKFRNELFKKEKDLDRQSSEFLTYLEWKKTNNVDIGTDAKILHLEGLHEETKPAHVSQAMLFAELREAFEAQKLYLDPELNLKTVIKVLGTNKKYLYQAINENSDNFRSFLNRYRVDEAKRIIEHKIRRKEELNLSELYVPAGFNSAVPFYRAFKLLTGLTPKNYADEVRREVKQEASRKS